MHIYNVLHFTCVIAHQNTHFQMLCVFYVCCILKNHALPIFSERKVVHSPLKIYGLLNTGTSMHNNTCAADSAQHYNVNRPKSIPSACYLVLPLDGSIDTLSFHRSPSVRKIVLYLIFLKSEKANSSTSNLFLFIHLAVLCNPSELYQTAV